MIIVSRGNDKTGPGTKFGHVRHANLEYTSVFAQTRDDDVAKRLFFNLYPSRPNFNPITIA